jgi:O-antigen/teichoic acid export membrane protein
MVESLKDKTVKGMKWSALERFSVQGLQFLIQIFLARILLPSDYGVIAVLTVFISIAQTFVDSGFSNALIQKLDRDEDDYTTAFLFNIGVGAFFYFILYFSAPYIADFYNMPILTSITKVIGLVVFFNSLCIVQQSILMIKIDFKNQTFISLVAVTLSGILAFYLATHGYGAWALAWQAVAAAFFRALFFWIFVKWTPKGRFTKKSFKRLFSFGSKLLLSGLLNTIYQNIYVIVIGKFYTSKTLGFYSKAKELSFYPAASVTNIIQRVSYPVLSRMQNEDERLHDNYRKLIRLSAFIFFPLMIGLAATADPFVRLLLTDKWENSILLLQILCFSMMWYPIHAINLNLLQVKGRSDLFLRLEIIKRVVITIILIFTLPLGLVALCIGQVVNSLLALFFNTYYTGKFIKVSFFSQLKDLLPVLIASGIMFAVIFLINQLIANLLLKLILDIVIGALVYTAIMWRSYEFKELKTILKQR